MAFEKVNSKVVRIPVTTQNPVLARRGAMLGYEGNVTFRPVHGQGQGVGGFVGAAMSGESNPMMATEGNGSVLYGFRGLHVTEDEAGDREEPVARSDGQGLEGLVVTAPGRLDERSLHARGSSAGRPGGRVLWARTDGRRRPFKNRRADRRHAGPLRADT